MVYDVLIYPSAEADINEIKKYFEDELQTNIDPLLDEFIEIVSYLESNPFMFPIVNDKYLAQKEYRKFPIGNYLVFYVIVDRTVQIRRILFGKRLYSDIL